LTTNPLISSYTQQGWHPSKSMFSYAEFDRSK